LYIWKRLQAMKTSTQKLNTTKGPPCVMLGMRILQVGSYTVPQGTGPVGYPPIFAGLSVSLSVSLCLCLTGVLVSRQGLFVLLTNGWLCSSSLLKSQTCKSHPTTTA
jgi:hypothetical protein